MYLPIVRIIREERLLSRFPKATEADLYVYIGHHWAELGRKYGPIFTLEEAAEDYSNDSRRSPLARRLKRWGRQIAAVVEGHPAVVQDLGRGAAVAVQRA